jgi:hypothetical protein
MKYMIEMAFIFVGVLVLFLMVAEVNINSGIHNRQRGFLEGVRAYQIDAIERGFAEWKVNPDGTTEFRWKESKVE